MNVGSSRLVGSVAGSAPTVGSYEPGDFVTDRTGGVWVCTVGGSPGTWLQASGSPTPSWQALTLGTNISALASFNTPAATLYGSGLLLLSGAISVGGVISGGATIFTLPSAGMFPATKLRFVLGDSNSNGSPAALNTDGTCVTQSGFANGVTVGLDGLILRLV